MTGAVHLSIVPVCLGKQVRYSAALSHKLIIVTRNTTDFTAIAGLQVLNPWA